MATENMHSAKARLYLNAGTNPHGRIIVKNTLVSYLVETETATAEKVQAVANALAPCLEHPAIRLERVISSTIE